MDLTKLSDSDLQALSSGDISKVSDEGLGHLSGQAQPEQSFAQRISDPERWKSIAGMDSKYNAGGELRGQPGNKFDEVTAGTPPMVAPVGSVPGAVGKLAEFLGASAPRRIATNAAYGAAEGAAKTPQAGDSRLGNAAWGAGINAGLGGLMEGGAAVYKKGAQWAGGKLGGLTNTQAASYAGNPAEADRLSDMNRNNPIGLSDEVRNQVKGGLDDAFENVSRPALEKVGQKLVGKTVAAKPDDFSGTAAGSEIERAWNTQGNTNKVDVPVFEKAQTEYTPVKTDTQIGDEIKSPMKDGMAGITNETPVPARQVTRSVQPQAWQDTGFGGQPVEGKTALEDLLIPRGTQKASVPAPLPDSVSLTGQQALSAKRASQQAANYNRSLNPIGYNAANDAEAQAGGRMRKAIEGVAPDTAGLNDTIEQASRYAAHAKATMGTNPAQILTESDSLGSVPTRSMRQFLDQNAGTNLEGLAKSLDAGRAMNDPDAAKGLLDRVLAKPAARTMLKSVNKADSLKDILYQALRSEEQK